MLDTLRRTIQEVNRAPDLQRALAIIVSRVKQAMLVDVCSVYLVDAEDRSTSLSRLMPSGVSSKAQAKISATGKPMPSTISTCSWQPRATSPRRLGWCV